MTVREFLAGEYARSLGHNERVAVEYSGVVHVSPDAFRAIVGVEADFSRPACGGQGGEPVSVVYMCHPLTGEYRRENGLVSYNGPVVMRGPLGGMHVPPSEPVVFVVTRG